MNNYKLSLLIFNGLFFYYISQIKKNHHNIMIISIKTIDPKVIIIE